MQANSRPDTGLRQYLDLPRYRAVHVRQDQVVDARTWVVSEKEELGDPVFEFRHPRDVVGLAATEGRAGERVLAPPGCVEELLLVLLDLVPGGGVRDRYLSDGRDLDE